jgi:hypothetical protein
MERKNEKPLIEHIKALEKELDETKKYYEEGCRIQGGTIKPGYSKGKVSTCVVFKPNRNRRDNRKRSIRQWL